MSDDGCTPFRELLSAQLDGQLAPGEEDALLAHLTRCSGCGRARARLRRTVDALRRAGPLVPTGEAALRALEARLAGSDERADACEQARERISARRDGQLAAGEDGALARHLTSCEACRGFAGELERTVAAMRAAGPLVPLPQGAFEALARRLRAPAGRVVRWPTAGALLRFAAAASFLALATYLAATRFPLLVERMARHRPPQVDAQPVAPGPQRTPSADPSEPAPTERPGPTPAPEPRPEPDPDEGRPERVPETRPAPSPQQPELAAGPQEPDPPQPAPTDPEPAPRLGPSTAPRPPEPAPPTPPAIELAALEWLLERIGSPDLPPHERPLLVESLGEARFDAPPTYAYLRAILERGVLDRFPEPHRSRRAACLALGRLGSATAVDALLAAPVRPAWRDGDEAALAAGLALLRDDASIARLGAALASASLDEGRRYLVVAALLTHARPAAAEGLAAVFGRRREPAALRREAGLALGWTGHPDAFPALEAGLTDRRELVRQGAALGLGALAARLPERASACVAALEAVAEAPREEPPVAEAAVLALGRTRHRGAVEPLLARLDPGERRRGVRVAAHRSLCRLAGREPAGVSGAEEWRAWWASRDPAEPLGTQASVAPDRGFRAVVERAAGVVFVVDLSGSMEPKRALLRYELEQALRRCSPEVGFQVIVFGDAPHALWPDRRLVPASAAARREALERVARQPVWRGAKTALTRALLDALAHEDADTIYLLSDGQVDAFTGDAVRQAVRRALRERTRPVRLHTVHLRDPAASVRLDLEAPDLADPPDVDLMRRLAAEHDGLYSRN